MAGVLALLGLLAAVGAAVVERAPVTGTLLTLALIAAWWGSLDD